MDAASGVIKAAFTSRAWDEALARWPRNIADEARGAVPRGWVVLGCVVGVIAAAAYGVVRLLALAGLPSGAGVALVVVAVAMLVQRFVLLPERMYQALSAIPQPPRFPFTGHLYQGIDDSATTFDKLERMCARHNPGALVTWAFAQPLVLITDPDAVRAIVTADYAIAPKNMLTQVFLDGWLGKGLLTAGGHVWKTQRKLITPAFHFGALRTYFDVYKKHAGKLVEVLRAHVQHQTEHYREPFDIVPLVTCAGLDIIAETACGYELNSQQGPNAAYALAVKEACELLIDHINYHPEIPPLLWHTLFDDGRRCLRAINMCKSTCRRIIEQRMAQRASGAADAAVARDFLDILIDAQDDDGGAKLSPQSILDNVNTFIFAGHDTTTVALSWLLFEVSIRPHIEANLVAELLEVLGGRAVEQLDYDDLKQLKYMENVIKESLRLHPSVPIYGRYIESAIDCGKFTIPANTEIFIPALTLHRLPEHWECPEVFDPERFTTERSSGRHPFVYLPFSTGSRNCIGQFFALNVEKTLLAHLLFHFHFETSDVLKVQHSPSIVLHPKKGIHVTGRERYPGELESLARLATSPLVAFEAARASAGPAQ